MNVIDKMERKFGHFGIPRLMVYVLGLSVMGNILNLAVPGFFYSYLGFDVYQILHGQVWRLFTFLMYPTLSSGSAFIVDLIWYVIWLSLYYFIGNALEQAWGTFRFTVYYISGILIIWIIGFVFYFIYQSPALSGAGQEIGYMMGLAVNPEYLNTSLFLVFAMLYKDIQLLLYFVIPVKAKWLGIIDLVYILYQFAKCLRGGYYLMAALIFGSLINCAIYFFFGRGGRMNPVNAYKRKKRKIQYRKGMGSQGGQSGRRGQRETMHRCAICGRTELDDPNLQFRYCTRCEGNYEYCNDHLFTHEHVRK